MIKFLDKKLFRYLSVFLFLNSSILPVKSSSALAAWAINTDGVLELRTCLLYTSDAGKTQGAAIAPADKERVKKIREQMPSLKHRKNKLFSN